ncbi:aminotransferase class I/II-fold pyridoxal phosphate-dependent enzyme [Poseidonocella sp. HB161398]|uniref:aminotransferase class I/II-fold pyridoxal phosphate-dependent enzyme n=1 Tax=Poseidonocella sp. HB161398 TaxID=2320855 RepID=UPI001108B1D9|nr:aminotransferase class I/II-fold pyridoxal phosphate-dependent enzyme [Poseidonocella sp. HB161398]
MGRLLGRYRPAPRGAEDIVNLCLECRTREDALDLSGEHALTAERGLLEFAAVAEMRRRLAEAGGFLREAGPATGDSAFQIVLHDYLMPGQLLEEERHAVISTPGGRGALWMALAMLRELHPETTLWLPAPGRRLQAELVAATGLNQRYYPYSDGSTLRTEDMLATLAAMAPGDVLLLQACGQDPTGIDLPPELWAALAGLCIATGAVPLVDISHAGLCTGPQSDLDGAHGLAIAVPEAFLAFSCSSSFTLHGERTGMLLVRAETMGEAVRASDMMEDFAATGFGPAARPGQLIVTDLLGTRDQREDWEAALRQLRMGLGETRAALAAALETATGEARWQALATGLGLFSQLPLTGARRLHLWAEHGIGIAPDGRINLSGLNAAAIARIAEGVAASLAAPEEALEGIGDRLLDALSPAPDPAEDGEPPETGAEAADGDAPDPAEEDPAASANRSA